MDTRICYSGAMARGVGKLEDKMNDVTWMAALFGRVVWAGKGDGSQTVEVSVHGTGITRVCAKMLDVEALELFPRGTALLVQIHKGVLIDWTLYPTKGFDGTSGAGGYTLPGDEWKNG
jgi:hypothetical protein